MEYLSTGLGPSALLQLALGLLAFGVKIWAMVDAVTRPGPAYPAAGKLTKPIWVAILAAAIVLTLGNPFDVLGLFGIVGLVAAIVYLVDVRPAIRDLGSGGSG